MRLWERIYEDSQDFGRGFMRIPRFGRGFMRIHGTLGEDSWGFMRLWERICEDL